MNATFSSDSLNPVLDSLKHGRRRHVLRILQSRVGRIPEEELAINLAAAEQGKSLLDVSTGEVQTIRTDLVHVHLPPLASADFIEWDSVSGFVATTSHPALQDPLFTDIIENDANDWDAVIANLAHRRRRVILASLKRHGTELTRTDIAREILAHETDELNDPSLNPTRGTLDELRTALHHRHLPALDAAELIEYDRSVGIATYDGHPDLTDELLDFRVTDTTRAVLTDAELSKDIWRIEGRENVTERGRALFDLAEEELFLMLTGPNLFEGACVRQLRATIDRGVDVYLGTQTQELRDFVREEFPEVTVWEPQLDWLNMPPNREKVGRLVMADRTAVMVGTIGEENDNGVHTETAITGSGENNALVMLLREVLGSRLDHLDEQSEDFLSQIPL